MTRSTKRTLRWHPLRITDPVYGVEYIVLWNVKNTTEEALAVIQYVESTFIYKVKPEDVEHFTIGDKSACTTSFGRGMILIQFGHQTYPGVSSLVHEALHAMMSVFTWRGVHLNGDDDEHGAYYLGWLCKAITEQGHKYDLWGGQHDR
jgi:hypothetical protein